MSAISGTHRTYSLLADGTLRIKVDIEPRDVAKFHAMFPSADMPIAIAPLVADFESRVPESKHDQEIPKGGKLANLAGMLCDNPAFQKFIGATDSDNAAEIVRFQCGIQSRAELDHNPEAANLFHLEFRIPFVEMEVR